MLKRTLAILFVVQAIAGSLAPASAMPRLPRSVFDVIPPSDRVTGARGSMQVYQAACRIGPTIQARRRIVDVAVQEWAFFGFQTIDATHAQDRVLPPGLVPDAVNPTLAAPRIVREMLNIGSFEDEPEVDSTIGGYWSATPDGGKILDEQNAAWTGGGEGVSWAEPWSAAFVSWVMCEAGLGDMAQFHRSISHADYVDQAIHARDGAAPDAAYFAYDAGEQPIEPGDLLCNSRAGTEYRSLADRRPQIGTFVPLHCDVVVKVAGDRVFVIGGNVLQSVTLTILPLARDAGRYARPAAEGDIAGATTLFAHLKLKASPIALNALDDSPTIKALKAD